MRVKTKVSPPKVGQEREFTHPEVFEAGEMHPRPFTTTESHIYSQGGKSIIP